MHCVYVVCIVRVVCDVSFERFSSLSTRAGQKSLGRSSTGGLALFFVNASVRLAVRLLATKTPSNLGADKSDT